MKMKKRTQENIDYGISIGWVLEGLAGDGHYLMRHANGEVVKVASTPGDRRGDQNCRAEMRRKAGVANDGPNSGSYRKGMGSSGFSMAAAMAEFRKRTPARERELLSELRRQAASDAREVRSLKIDAARLQGELNQIIHALAGLRLSERKWGWTPEFHRLIEEKEGEEVAVESQLFEITDRLEELGVRFVPVPPWHEDRS